MKKLFLIIVLTATLSSCGWLRKVPPNQAEPELEKVVTAIQHQYTLALDSLKKSGVTNIEINEAEISLKVTKSIETGAEIKVLIFKPSGKRTVSQSSTVTYTLSKEEDQKGGAEIIKLIDNNLRDIIVGAAGKFNKLDRKIGDLVAENFSIDLVFSIENTLGGGLSFEVLGMSMDASTEFGRSAEHELKLTFKKKKTK